MAAKSRGVGHTAQVPATYLQVHPRRTKTLGHCELHSPTRKPLGLPSGRDSTQSRVETHGGGLGRENPPPPSYQEVRV